MASWAARRQLSIFLTLSLVAAGLVAGGYVLLKGDPSCTDGIKNQNEIDIDCGGSCVRVCKQEAADLLVLWNKVFRVNDGRYDAAAFIENPNPSFGVRKAKYSFKIYDSKNLLIAQKAGETFINPKERFVVFLPAIDTGKRIPARAFIEFEEPFWERLAQDTTMSKVAIENKSFEAGDMPLLTADVVNISPGSVSGIDIHAVVVDSGGNAIGVSRTLVPSLAKGERKGIIFTWPKPFEKEAALTDLYLRVNATSKR